MGNMKSVNLVSVSIMAVVSMVFVTLWKVQKLPPQIPLFYSQPTAATQIADTLYLGLLPLTAVMLIGINSLLLKRIVRDELLAHAVINIANLVIVGAVALIYIQIILLVT